MLDKMKSIKAIFRRGQYPKLDGQNLGENLSRTSSITNLDADQKSSKGAKPRKSASRDRIDKLGENKKNDKKGFTKNNNKLDVENTYPSADHLPEEELQHLRRQLQEMAQEKTNLALQLGEQKGQLNNLQKEIQKLRSFQEESNIQLEHLTEENTALRNRLRDVAHSPLSDNEKQQLLFDTHRHHSSSAPASIATNIIEEGNGPDTTCTTPDWDKHSSSNVSEVSVACLQDKINQMQETHYSTNEELQATLQELTDLQRQLTELQQENERLNDEKTLMFDSLCRQTERLNDSRSEVESLKQLLYQEKDDTGQYESAVEREQKLVDLLKSAQEEREGLLVKIEQLNNEVQEARTGIVSKEEQIGQLRERVRTLECTLDAKHAEHKLLDQELAQAKDQCSGKQIEINRLTDLLDNARTKIIELEQDRALSDKSELDELLDNARKEKDALESEVAHLKEQLAISKNEIEKLKEQVSILQEECKVTRNNAKTTQSDLEYKCEMLQKEKNSMSDQLQEFQEALNELQVQSQCQLEDKRQLSSVLSETQRNLSEAERKNLMLENEVEELKKLRAEENDEWEKFQDDLLTSVRVANDFKTEAQQELQRMILENKSYRERERQLKAEIEKLKGETFKKGAQAKASKDFDTMDILVKRPNRTKNKPRKSKDSSGTSSGSSNRSEPVKKRPIRPSRQKRLKTLSIEEETLLQSLDTYNKSIDLNIPEENLTEEQKVIRKLKVIFEDEQLKVKPVAPKAKDQLAISKPLLDSVLSNSKLMKIVRDPNVKTIEDIALFAKETPEIRTLIQDIDRSARGWSEDYGRAGVTKRISIIGRSMSLDDMYDMEEFDGSPGLYRTFEEEDLTKEIRSLRHRESSVVPSDSASNQRYSDFSVVVNRNGESSEANINYTTLDRIVQSIPKDIDESQLTKEQKFAIKLSKALEERKNTLKKLANAKKLSISKPTVESVVKHPKLKEILLDPDVREVGRRNSDTQGSPPEVVKVLEQSKSYDDINFCFRESLDESKSYDDINFCFREGLDERNSSNGTFSSAEFDVEAGVTGPYNPHAFDSCRKMQFSTFLDDQEDPIDEGGLKKETNVSDEIFTRKSPNKRVKEHKFSDEDSFPTSSTSCEQSNEVSIRTNSKAKHKLAKSIGDGDDSLVYNDTLTKTREQGEGVKNESVINGNTYRVDLLQEKIKKIIKTDKKIDSVSRTSEEKAGCEGVDKTTDKTHHDSLIYNETLNKKLKTTSSFGAEKSDRNENELLVVDKVDTELEEKDTSLLEIPAKGSSSTKTENEEIDLEEMESAANTAVRLKTQDDDKIKKISEQLEVIHKLISEDKKDLFVNKQSNESFTPHLESSMLKMSLEPSYSAYDTNVPKDEENSDYLRDQKDSDGELDDEQDSSTQFATEVISDTSVINETVVDAPETFEYDYHAILKENRYGVKSPLNYRLSYKDVVHEIKSKFPVTELGTESNQELSDEENGQSFIRRRTDDEQKLENAARIDKEMDDIFENYLHTRVSKIIKESEVKPQQKMHDSTEITQPDVSSSEKIEDTEFDTLKEESISFSDIPIPKPRTRISEVTLISENEKENEDSVKSTQPVDDVNHENVVMNFEPEKPDQSLLEFVQDSGSGSNSENRYDIERPPKIETDLDSSSEKAWEQTEIGGEQFKEEEINIIQSFSSKNHPDSPLYDISQRDFVEESFDTSETPYNINRPPKVEIDLVISPEKAWKQTEIGCEQLTEDEMNIVLRAKTQRFSRPLSDFNQNDWEMVERLSLSYSIENQHPKTCQEPSVKEEKSSKDERNSDDGLLKNPDTNLSPLYVMAVVDDNEKNDIKTLDIDAVIQEDLKLDDHPVISDYQHNEQSLDEIPEVSQSTDVHKDDAVSQRSLSNKKSFEEADKMESKDQVLPKKPMSEDGTDEIKEQLIVKSGDPDDLDGILRRLTSYSSSNRRKVNQTVQGRDNSVTIRDENKKNITDMNITTVDHGELQESPITPSPRESRFSQSIRLKDEKKLDSGAEKVETLADVVVLRSSPQARSLLSFHSDEKFTNRTPRKMRKERPLSASKTVKSVAQHFERLSLDGSKKYEPVYTSSTITSRNINRFGLSYSSNLEKEHLSRNKNQVITYPVKSDDIIQIIDKDDKSLGVRKMIENEENFSENEHDNVTQKRVTEVPGLHESDVLPTEKTQDLVEGDKLIISGTEELKKSECYSDKMQPSSNDNLKKTEDDAADLASGTSTNYSTIDVAGKSEQLDITKPSECGVAEPATENASNLNLFHLESPSFDDSYLNLFKTPQERLFDDLSKKKPKRGYFNITYLGELSDSESYDNDEVDKLGKDYLQQTGSKPKIIDFVPLDEATKPVFNKDDLPDYNTLEREKTFQVFNSASKVNELVEKRESKGGSSSRLASSRTSFSAAKKVFEALEAKSDSKTASHLPRKASTTEKQDRIEENSDSQRESVEENK